MKLLLCIECQDIIKLQLSDRTCKCERSGGRYLEDELHAEYHGPAVPIGLSNADLVNAIVEYTESQGSHRFSAFTIPDSAPTMARTDDTVLPNLKQRMQEGIASAIADLKTRRSIHEDHSQH